MFPAMADTSAIIAGMSPSRPSNVIVYDRSPNVPGVLLTTFVGAVDQAPMLDSTVASLSAVLTSTSMPPKDSLRSPDSVDVAVMATVCTSPTSGSVTSNRYVPLITGSYVTVWRPVSLPDWKIGNKLPLSSRKGVVRGNVSSLYVAVGWTTKRS